MGHLLLVLVPLGLAAAVSPVMLTEQTVLLAGDRGLRAGSAYAAGTALVLVVVVGAVLLVGRSVALPRTPRLDATLDLVIGGLLLALGLVAWLSQRRPHRRPSHAGSRALAPPAALAFGLFSMATNVTTLALVVPASKEIAANDLPLWDSLPSALVLVALAALPGWGPVALDAAAPTTAQRVLTSLERLIRRRGRQLVVGLLVAAGLFLVGRGTVHLVEQLGG